MGPVLGFAAAVAAVPVGVDGLPVAVQADEPWRASVRGAGALTLARDAPAAEFALRREPGVQRDLAVDEARAALEAELARVGSHLTWGEVSVERREHPVLGPLFVLATDGRVGDGPDPVRMRFATWAGPAGQLVLGGGIYAEPARADALFAEALDQLVWREPPVPRAAFTWGHAALDGYSLELPDGWRLVHPGEREVLGLSADQALAFDPAGGGAGLGCATNRDPIEVIAPDRAEGPAAQFRARARVLLAGGGPGLRDVRRAVDPRDPVQRAPVRVEDEGALEVVQLGDRGAYLWRVAGEVDEAPVQVAWIETTFAERVVDCLYVTAQPEVPAEVLAALKSLRITDGAPPVRTWTGAYLERWPFRHPLLQIWWLGAAAALAAGIVAVRSAR